MKVRPKRRSRGYVFVRGKPEHRAVLLARIGPGEHPCHWCWGIVSWDVKHPARRALTVDHLNGVKDDNRPENLVPAHGACNARRVWSRRRAAAREVVAALSRWASLSGAAQALGVDRRTVRRWAVQIGAPLPPTGRPGVERTWTYRLDLARWRAGICA